MIASWWSSIKRSSRQRVENKGPQTLRADQLDTFHVFSSNEFDGVLDKSHGCRDRTVGDTGRQRSSSTKAHHVDIININHTVDHRTRFLIHRRNPVNVSQTPVMKPNHDDHADHARNHNAQDDEKDCKSVYPHDAMILVSSGGCGVLVFTDESHLFHS